jgi:hypothetical protein
MHLLCAYLDQGVAVGAEQYALAGLHAHSIDTPGQTLHSEVEALQLGI